MYREKIDEQIASAMKSGDKVCLSVWRAIKTEFVKFKTSGAGAELTDERELQIITKMVQQRKDSIEQYANAKRDDLVEQENGELAILESLLPKEPTEDEIKEAVGDIVSTLGAVPTMKDMKTVMSGVKTKYPTVNGGLVSKIFKENFIN